MTVPSIPFEKISPVVPRKLPAEMNSPAMAKPFCQLEMERQRNAQWARLGSLKDRCVPVDPRALVVAHELDDVLGQARTNLDARLKVLDETLKKLSGDLAGETLLSGNVRIERADL